MPSDKVPKGALRWTPTGKRKIGWSKTTWQRTVMKEPVEFDLTLGKTVANTDRTGLIGNVLLRLHVFIRDGEIEMDRDRTS